MYGIILSEILLINHFHDYSDWSCSHRRVLLLAHSVLVLLMAVLLLQTRQDDFRFLREVGERWSKSLAHFIIYRLYLFMEFCLRFSESSSTSSCQILPRWNSIPNSWLLLLWWYCLRPPSIIWWILLSIVIKVIEH